jgi:flagellar biosynthesis GTPase FlhF
MEYFYIIKSILCFIQYFEISNFKAIFLKMKKSTKSEAKKSVAKKSLAKKSLAKKSVAKKSVAKKSVAKKSEAKKSEAKKSVAKKSVAKKSLAKKSLAKKSISKKKDKIKFNDDDLKNIIKFIKFNDSQKHLHENILKVFTKNGITQELPYVEDDLTLTEINNIQNIIEPIHNILRIMFQNQKPRQCNINSFNFVNSSERIYISRYIFTKNDGCRYILIKVLKKQSSHYTYLFFVKI